MEECRRAAQQLKIRRQNDLFKAKHKIFTDIEKSLSWERIQRLVANAIVEQSHDVVLYKKSFCESIRLSEILLYTQVLIKHLSRPIKISSWIDLDDCLVIEARW